jgi:phage tail-like protein
MTFTTADFEDHAEHEYMAYVAEHPELDCLPAYLDPATAPADLVEWLAGWVGVAIAPGMPERRRRQLVAAAARLYVWRGTLSAIGTIVELSSGQTRSSANRAAPAGRRIRTRRCLAGQNPGSWWERPPGPDRE